MPSTSSTSLNTDITLRSAGSAMPIAAMEPSSHLKKPAFRWVQMLATKALKPPFTAATRLPRKPMGSSRTSWMVSMPFFSSPSSWALKASSALTISASLPRKPATRPLFSSCICFKASSALSKASLYFCASPAASSFFLLSMPSSSSLKRSFTALSAALPAACRWAGSDAT